MVRKLTFAVGVLLCSVLGSAAPALAVGGSIGGTVTSAADGEGIGGLWVCASSHPFGPMGGCASTDSEGEYEIENLQPGFFEVAFEEEGRQNYVAQWYPGKAIREEAGWVEVQGGAVSGIDAVLQVGGQITGRVIDLESGEPIEGLEVCAPQIDRVSEFGVIHCDESDAAGEYTVHALATGLYKVEFNTRPWSPEPPNFIRQYFPGKPSWGEATVLPVSAGGVVAGIDAAMQRGVAISGTVTDAAGAPVVWQSRVCALDASSEAIVQCAPPEAEGHYWIAGLPFGSYKVSFGVDVEEEPGLVLHPDGFLPQYFNGKPTFAAANVLESAGPAAFTGIDARLVRGEDPAKLRPPILSPPTSGELGPAQKKPLRCRKGFRKKRVKGRSRCVKIHRKKRQRQHGRALAGR